MIAAVLLVPRPGHPQCPICGRDFGMLYQPNSHCEKCPEPVSDPNPHGLLKEGPCGARPPMAWQDKTDDGNLRWHPLIGPPEWNVRGDPVALVLAWDGEPVAEGCYRLFLVDRGWDGPGWCGDWASNMSECMGFAKECGEPLGTVVHLDAEGREVSP